MDAHEYSENLHNDAIRNYRDSYNELRYMLAGDTDMLEEHHGWEAGESITDKMSEIDSNNNTFEIFSGFSLNKDFKMQWADDDAAYVIFEVSTHEKWFIGQRGDVAISYSQDSLQRIEGLGYSHEGSELFQFIENNVRNPDFQNMNFEPDEDEMDERLQVELGVDTAAEWLLQNGHEANGDMVSYKSFVGALEMFEYDANAAAGYLLEQGEYNVDTLDGVEYGKADFVAEIEMHVDAIEKLKLQSDWDDVVRVFKVDEDKVVGFDADDFEDELNEAFPNSNVEVDPEPEQKAKKKFKPGM